MTIFAIWAILSILVGGLFLCCCIAGARADRRVMLPDPPKPLLALPAPITPLLLPAP